MEHTTIRPSELAAMLAICDATNTVPFILSAPGLGKSSIIRQYAESRKQAKGIENPLYPIYLGHHSPTDICGFPHIDAATNRMRFSIPAMLPTEPGCTLALDEFTNGSKQSQNMALQIALERRVGEWVAPKDTFIVLAGNGKDVRCHVEKLSAAMANRVMFLHLVADLNDWTRWALDSGVDTRTIAFCRLRPELLHSFNPAKWDGEEGYPSPRSWERVSEITKHGIPRTLQRPAFEGLVGKGASVEYSSFLDTVDKVPNPDAILADPLGAMVPDEPAARYAVSAALIMKATKNNFGRVIAYVSRLPKEFEVFAIRSATKVKPEVVNTREFIGWCADNADNIL